MQPAISLVDKSLYNMYEYIVADVAGVPVALEYCSGAVDDMVDDLVLP
jgi:hypothetical protein